jgi:hypothetical protein
VFVNVLRGRGRVEVEDQLSVPPGVSFGLAADRTPSHVELIIRWHAMERVVKKFMMNL